MAPSVVTNNKKMGVPLRHKNPDDAKIVPKVRRDAAAVANAAKARAQAERERLLAHTMDEVAKNTALLARAEAFAAEAAAAAEARQEAQRAAHNRAQQKREVRS